MRNPPLALLPSSLPDLEALFAAAGLGASPVMHHRRTPSIGLLTTRPSQTPSANRTPRTTDRGHALTRQPSPSYLVHPLDVSVQLGCQLSDPESLLEAKARADVSPIRLQLTSAQLRDMLRVMDDMSVLGLRTKYGRFRPRDWRPAGPGGSWRQAWRYAIRSVIAGELGRRRRSFAACLPGSF